jgi:hypothetical protein
MKIHVGLHPLIMRQCERNVLCSKLRLFDFVVLLFLTHHVLVPVIIFDIASVL